MRHPNLLALNDRTRSALTEEGVLRYKQTHFQDTVLPLLLSYGELLGRRFKMTDGDIAHFMAMPENKDHVLDYFYETATEEATHRSMLPNPVYKDGLLVQTYSIFSISMLPIEAVKDLILKSILGLKNVFNQLSEDVQKISMTISNESQRSNRETLRTKSRNILSNAEEKFRANFYKCLLVITNGGTEFSLSKQRFKYMLDRTELLKMVIIGSKTEDEQDLTFLQFMEEADQFIRNLMLCHLKTFETKKEHEFVTSLELHLVHPSSSGEEYLCQHTPLTSGEPEVATVLNIFMHLEKQYDSYYKLRFKPLCELRTKNMNNTAVRTITPAYTALQASASSSSSSSSASTPVDGSDKKPKRYQQSSETKVLDTANNAMKSVRTFAGMKIDTSLVATIRKSSCTQYFYMDLTALADANINIENFTDIPVKFAAEAGDTGLKHIGKHEVKCNINGVVHTLDANYELKQKHNTDRILVVQVPCDQKEGHESLFVGLIGLPGGLHDGDKLKLDPNKIYTIRPPECSQLNIAAFSSNNKASLAV